MLAESINIGNSRVFGESVKGLKWKLEEVDQRLVGTLVQKLGIPEILALVLCNRGVSNAEQAALFLDPKLKDLLPDPFALKDMEKAAERIAQAVINKEKIAVFGDYDVDGATSTALLRRFLGSLGVNVTVYIPNRIIEGYGPNSEAFKKLKDEGNSLVLTVDCGTVSFDPIRDANSYGLDVIILDHHLSMDVLPEAHAVVNPNRFDEDFPFKSIAAVGIAFLTAVAIRATLRKKGWFSGKEEIDLLQYLDLVALGTVCDVMSLTGVNRAFVTQGLKLIAARNNVGLATLANVSKLDSKPQSYHLGFILGPRINAGGRVGEGILGSNLLATDDPVLALNIASKLDQLNTERRAIENIILEQAINEIESQELYRQPMIIVKGDNWHQGILGILASRIKERYNRPAAVISVIDGAGKGSGRSIDGIDLGTLLARAKEQGILLQGGGHAMAGGFTVAVDRIEEFRNYVNETLKGKDHLIEKAKEYSIDSVITVLGATGKLVQSINQAAPFGSGNPQPRFALCDVVILNIRLVGASHMMVIVSDDKQDSNTRVTLKCMLFKALDSTLGKALGSSVGKKVNLFGTLQINFNDDRRADFIIEDMSFI
jgi:single-stranded-DNA-specific exonuclease